MYRQLSRCSASRCLRRIEYRSNEVAGVRRKRRIAPLSASPRTGSGIALAQSSSSSRTRRRRRLVVDDEVFSASKTWHSTLRQNAVGLRMPRAVLAVRLRARLARVQAAAHECVLAIVFRRERRRRESIRRTRNLAAGKKIVIAMTTASSTRCRDTGIASTAAARAEHQRSAECLDMQSISGLARQAFQIQIRA